MLELVVRSARAVATEVLSLELAAPDGAALPEWTPGAHLDLHLPSGLVRSYSLHGDHRDRDAYHVAGLWKGIGQGVADVLGSDHAPHTLEEKARLYPASPSGMPGVQTLLPVMLTHVAAGKLSLERLVDLTSAGAQRVFGTAGKGRMAVGYDGDLTIVDLKAKRTLRHADMATRSGWTPFDGMEVTGWPKATLIRGRVVMRDDEIIAPSLGRPVRFQETLAAG